MSTVNTVTCNATNANTGHSNCPVHLKFEGAIEVPASKRFTLAEVQALGTTLKAMLINDSKSLRANPFPAFIKNNSTGGDPVNVQFDNGQEIITWENFYKLNFSFYDGGMPLNNALRTRNGENTAFLFYGGGIVFGSLINGQYAGVPALNFWCMAQQLGSFKTENKYSWMCNVKPAYINEQVWFVQDDFGAGDLSGLKNVDLAILSAPPITAGVASLSALERGYGTDYIALYPGPMATVGLFTAKNKATGNAIAVTSVAVTNGKLVVTFNTADPNYPAAGGYITLVPPTITALIAAGITDAEISSIDILR